MKMEVMLLNLKHLRLLLPILIISIVANAMYPKKRRLFLNQATGKKLIFPAFTERRFRAHHLLYLILYNCGKTVLLVMQALPHLRK